MLIFNGNGLTKHHIDLSWLLFAFVDVRDILDPISLLFFFSFARFLLEVVLSLNHHRFAFAFLVLFYIFFEIWMIWVLRLRLVWEKKLLISNVTLWLWKTPWLIFAITSVLNLFIWVIFKFSITFFLCSIVFVRNFVWRSARSEDINSIFGTITWIYILVLEFIVIDIALIIFLFYFFLLLIKMTLALLLSLFLYCSSSSIILVAWMRHASFRILFVWMTIKVLPHIWL